MKDRLEPGTRVSIVNSHNEIMIRGDLYVVFAYVHECTVIGRDDHDEVIFGIMDNSVIEPFYAPTGPPTDD